MWISDNSGASSRRKTAPQRLPAIPSGGVSSHVSPCVLRVVPPAAAMLRWHSTIHAGYTHHATSVMCFSPAFYPTAIDDPCGSNRACCERDASLHVAVDCCNAMMAIHVSCRGHNPRCERHVLSNVTISDVDRRLMRKKQSDYDVFLSCSRHLLLQRHFGRHGKIDSSKAVTALHKSHAHCIHLRTALG